MDFILNIMTETNKISETDLQELKLAQAEINKLELLTENSNLKFKNLQLQIYIKYGLSQDAKILHDGSIVIPEILQPESKENK